MEVEIPIIKPDKSKSGYWTIYSNRKVWHSEKKEKLLTQVDIINQELDNIASKQMLKFPSKQQLDDAKPKFPLLTQDDYNLMIVKVEQSTQNKYMAKADASGLVPQEDIVKITLEVVSHKDGKPAYDEKGGEAIERKLFFTAKPDSMGYMTDGTPAKTRQLIAYSTGQKINGELQLETWDALIGKTIFAQIIQKVNTKGNITNRISRFISPRQERVKPKTEPKTETKPVPAKKEEPKKE